MADIATRLQAVRNKRTTWKKTNYSSSWSIINNVIQVIWKHRKNWLTAGLWLSSFFRLTAGLWLSSFCKIHEEKTVPCSFHSSTHLYTPISSQKLWKKNEFPLRRSVASFRPFTRIDSFVYENAKKIIVFVVVTDWR